MIFRGRRAYYLRRKPIDIGQGLTNLTNYVTRQAIEQATPAVTSNVLSAITTTANVSGVSGVAIRGSGTISGGAGFRGGTSPAGKAILSAYNKAKASSKRR